MSCREVVESRGGGGWGVRQAISDAITKHTGVKPIDPPPPPKVVAYGEVPLGETALLTQQLGVLASGDGIHSPVPLVMEEYGQQYAPHPPSSILHSCCNALWKAQAAFSDILTKLICNWPSVLMLGKDW